MDLPISTEDLTRLYRYTLLLTGEEGAAQQVLFDACVDCAARLGSYRNEEGQFACLMGNVRQRAKLAAVNGNGGNASGRGIARAFATLPEEERAALAGLYAGLLPARALAEAMKMPLEQLGRVLKSARERLTRAGMAVGELTVEQTL